MFSEEGDPTDPERLEAIRIAEEDAEYAPMSKRMDAVVASEVLETKLEYGPEVDHFWDLIEEFEYVHSLEVLHAITELTPEVAKHHPVREPARLALRKIYSQLRVIENEEEISPEELKDMKLAKKRLSQAVGIIGKDNLVDHTR